MNGLPMTEEDGDDIYRITTSLNRGVNNLVVRSFGGSGSERSDTLQAFFLPGDSDVAELRLPEPRGGHTATRLLNGDLLVVGGSSLPTLPGVAEALRFFGSSPSATPRRIPTNFRRMEHTATRLPDGRVLIVGGSVIVAPTLVGELVEQVEIFTLGTETTSDRMTIVPVAGDPIRRSSHTAILFPVRRGGTVEIFLYLYGGYGDIRYRPEPRMGIRSDIRVFQFRNDSLVAAGPTFGPFIEALADHTTTAIQLPIGASDDYLVSGAFFVSETLYDTYAFESNFSTNVGIVIEDLEPMTVPRSGHAAGRMIDGEVLVFGGRTFSPTTAMRTVEVYHTHAKRFFPFPPDVGMLQERWGHTATNWDDNRILLLGGFGFAGAAVANSEWFFIDTRP